MTKFGKTITPYGANPEPHELETAKVFNKLGKDVTFIPPVYSKGVRTPDIEMDGIFWEIKSPIGNSNKTMKHSFKAALKQSRNIIFDLRRTKISDKECLSKLAREYRASKDAMRLLVILKKQKIVDIKK